MASLVMRWWLVCTALLLAVSAERAATTTGVVQPRNVRDEGLLQELPATIARALNRIRESKRDYHLVDDLWLEALPENADSDTKRSAFKSPSNSVVDLADSVFDTHRLSWHNSLVQGLDFNIYKDHTQKYVFDLTRQNENSHLSVTRTFGFQRRRLQLIMLPVMYKLGVITTLLTGLTVLSLKGVTIGVILLMLAITSVVAKLSKHQHYASPYAAMSPWAGPDPFDRSSMQHQLPQDKNIHVHVHTAPGAPPLSSNVVLRNPLLYDRDSPATADDSNGPYWDRANEEYYNAAMNHYYHNNHRFSNSDPTESTTKSVYHRWLG